MGERRCDSCGRTELEILQQAPADYQPFERSTQGQWLCRPCRVRLAPRPSGDEEVYEEFVLPPGLRQLVGKSARTICMVMDLPRQSPYKEVIDDAYTLQERTMGGWNFVTQWNDGSSVWQASDKSALAVLKFDGTMQIGKK